MNKQTFDFEFRRLIDVFGPKIYSEERIKTLWDIVKNCSDENFRTWVTRQISDSKFAPIGPEFREFELQDSKVGGPNKYNNEQSDPKKCSSCRGLGIVLAEKKSDRSIWSFVCDCGYGQNSHWNHPKKLDYETKPWAIPQWRDAKQSDYSY